MIRDGDGAEDPEELEALWETLLEVRQHVIEGKRARVEEIEAELRHSQRLDKLEWERAALVCALPDEGHLNKQVRYETMLNGQLDRLMNQLERLQRARQGHQVPAPLALDVNVTKVKEAG